MASVPVPDIAAYHHARYVPGNVVVAAAGSVDHDRIVELVQGTLPGQEDGGLPSRPEPAPPGAAPRLCFQSKETEQYHLCLGAPGLSRSD